MVKLAGPWRTTGRWWSKGKRFAFDYFDVETSDGTLRGCVSIGSTTAGTSTPSTTESKHSVANGRTLTAKRSPANRHATPGNRKDPPVSAARLRRGPIHDPRLIFFQAFLKRPREVASIVPSSRFLMRRAVRAAHLESARVVVELGPGTGGTTRALLRAMTRDARLVAIEINLRFARTIEAVSRQPSLDTLGR